MEGKVFNRVEKKYLITPTEKNQILKAGKNFLKKDQYFHSEVFNLYFDNDNYDLIIQSLDRPAFKEKIRARAYKGYDRVFVEVKTKLKAPDNNLGFKRRVMLSKKNFRKFIDEKLPLIDLIPPENSGELQIAKEIDYLIQYLHLQPKILVSCTRDSYHDSEDLRLTFDTNLKYREQDLDFTHKRKDKKYFADTKNVIMELKSGSALPLWLVHELSSLKIYSEQFSKIGKIYQKIRKEQNV